MRDWLEQARWFVLVVLALAGLVGCNAHHRGDKGTSETHFLESCSASCADGYACLCGVCTLACDDDAMCRSRGTESATCSGPAGDRNECDGVARLCDMHCTTADDCRDLGSEFECESGRCRAPMQVADAGPSAGANGAAGRSSAGSAAPPVDAGVVAPIDGGSPTVDASATAICELPPVMGTCEAAIPRYYHEPASGSCKLFTYGGCDGNANNFETLAECVAACGATGPHAPACQVDGIVYPSGTDDIPDPQSCNTCLCDAGQLICTEINCPRPCPEGTRFATSCSECGPTDICAVVRSECLPTCESSEDCTDGAPPMCFDGTCRILCG